MYRHMSLHSYGLFGSRNGSYPVVVIEALRSKKLAYSPTSTVPLSDGSSVPFAGLHLYDAFDGELSTNLSASPFSRGIFDPIEKLAPATTSLKEWKDANTAFQCLERDAEITIRSILHQIQSKPEVSSAHGLRHLDEASSTNAKRPKMSLSTRATKALQKYLLFLRFRNSERFAKLIRSAKISHTFLQQSRTCSRYATVYHPGNPLQKEPFFDWKSLLHGFGVYLSGSHDEHQDVISICNCIHSCYDRLVSAELCIGVSLDPDEYILSPSCLGVVAAEDEDEKNR